MTNNVPVTLNLIQGLALPVMLNLIQHLVLAGLTDVSSRALTRDLVITKAKSFVICLEMCNFTDNTHLLS